MQAVLQFVEFLRQFVQQRALLVLAALGEGRVGGVDARQLELAADAVGLEAGHPVS